MPAFGFHHRFVRPVELDIKRQTIRAKRKDGRQPCRAGDTLTLWANWRSKDARKIATVRCTVSTPVLIDTTDAGVAVTIGGRHLTPDQIKGLADEDSFESIDDFAAFFETTHGLPFSGWVIKW